MKISSFVRRFLKNEDGPTAVEYAIMLALIFGVIIVAVAALGSQTNDTYVEISNDVESAIVNSTGG